MAAIDHVHRRHISPAMLRMAVAHALAPELVQATTHASCRPVVGTLSTAPATSPG
jgi:hypothetical protein